MLFRSIPPDELPERLAEIDQYLKLAVDMIDEGKEVLAKGVRPPEYADDKEGWLHRLNEVENELLAIVNGNLKAELERRLLPWR